MAPAAVAARRLAIQDPRLTGRAEPMILNAAFLVPEESDRSFAAEVQRTAGQRSGITVELQGPWPPYSFAVLD